MVVRVVPKNEEDPIKNEVATTFSPIITQWKIYVAMETRVLIRPGPKSNTTLMMLPIKFDCDCPCCL